MTNMAGPDPLSAEERREFLRDRLEREKDRRREAEARLGEVAGILASETVEYGERMSGGGYHIRWDDPEAERIYPVADWIKGTRRLGGHVYRRRVIVVEDWVEVSKP